MLVMEMVGAVPRAFLKVIISTNCCGHQWPSLFDRWLAHLTGLSFVVLSKTVFAASVGSACQLG